MPRVAEPARLCAFNAGIQIVWGALLAVSLQSRSLELLPQRGLQAYAAIAASGALVATFVQLGAGVAADRRRKAVGHRVEFFVAGVVLAVPALVWFFAAPDIVGFASAFVLLQLGMNVATGPYQAVIADYVQPQRRGAASSWMSGYQSFGNVVGLLVAGFVRDSRLVVLALITPLVASAAFTLGALRTAAQCPADDARLVGPRKALGVLLLSRGAINVGFFTLLGFLLFFVRDSLGIRDAQALKTQTALLFITFTLAAIGGAIVAARPADRHDKRAVVSVAVGVIAVALAVFAGARSLAVAYPAAFLAGIGWGAFASADWALASIVLPGGAMATAMAIWNVATTVPQILAPLLTAPLVERVNAISAGLGPRCAVALALLEFVAGGALIWRLPRA